MGNKENGIEKVLWSIAIPGFGQFLNKQYFKGVILISLEVLINMNSNLNTAIISSFYGKIEIAVNQINYQWLLFYPCVYMYAIWDAYTDAVKTTSRYIYIPFVMAAYFGTIGVIYSSSFKVFGILLGPIWLSLLFIAIGFLIGFVFRFFILKWFY